MTDATTDAATSLEAAASSAPPTTVDDAPSGPSRRRRRRPLNKELLVVSFGIALGLVLVVFGLLSAVTGREALGIPDELESVSPAPNDRQVLRQTEVFVDLEAGLDAVLIVDGEELPVTNLNDIGALAQPGQQVTLPPTAIYDPGNFSIRFQPQDGAPIEEWSQGVHRVTVEFWRIDESRKRSRRFTWQFEVL